MLATRTSLAAVAAVSLCLGGAGAQDMPTLPEADPPVEIPAPPTEMPAMDDAAEEARSLDSLFAALKVSDEGDYKAIENQIMAVLARSDSASMTFLLARASRAMEAAEFDKALGFLDDLVRLEPDFAEAWNRRATVYFHLEQYGRSMADIQRALALEPRHFVAMAGMAIILDRLERPKAALEVFRRVLELHPHMEGAREAVERLAPDVDGREL